MQCCWSLPTSRTYQMLCLPLRLQTSLACTTCGNASGSSSPHVLPQVMACMRALIGSRGRFQERSERIQWQEYSCVPFSLRQSCHFCLSSPALLAPVCFLYI